jgi:ADP-ribose pyrophosphatase
MDPDADKPLETLFEGRWLRIRRRGRWEYVERVHAGGMAVIIVAATPERKLLFVEQERIPVEGPTIEMPAGLVGDEDGAETLEAAASRELLEETGWQAGRIEVMLVGPTSSGLTSERVAFVRATGLEKVGDGGGDATERIRVHEVPVDEAPAWLVRKMGEGYQLDAKLWAGLWLLDRNPDGSPA